MRDARAATGPRNPRRARADPQGGQAGPRAYDQRRSHRLSPREPQEQGDAALPSSSGSQSSSSGGVANAPFAEPTTAPAAPSSSSPSSIDMLSSTIADSLATASSSSMSSDLLSSSVSIDAVPTETYTPPWTYVPTATVSESSASEPSFVPGQVFNLTLAGDTDTEAIYSVPMTFGHESGDGYRRRKRGSTFQTFNMLVDFGSSDMWIAVKDCKTANCKSASSLFDDSQSWSPDAPQPLTFNYASGAVSGEIMWEQVTMGDFGIGYQAFLAADTVTDEDLGGGKFQGLVGLALPANSIIEEAIPGTTTSNPDGATFLDNLFGSGPSAPTNRLLGLSLARREDSRTLSSLSIGAVDERLCPLPCSPEFVPIVAHANLGQTGFLHWRVPLMGIRAYTFSDPASGQGSSYTNITLGPSVSDMTQKRPLAVLDSGGVQILVASKSFADAIYGAYGITSSSDGLYRMPCTQPLFFSFLIGTHEFAAHPLDMSWPDPNDPSRSSCIGAIQVSSVIQQHGDVVLGSSFLKNVYSVFKYPDQKSSRNWQPQVGLKSLIDPSVASADFYAVRNKQQSLETVSGGNGGPVVTSSGRGSGAAQHRVVSTAIIAACSVIGFFVLAAAAFCAWWFWLRRKNGQNAIVDYKLPPEQDEEKSGSNHKAMNSESTLRSRKHEETKRQKSMVDGFSDYEVESWRTNTEGESIGLASLREVDEYDSLVTEKAAVLGETLSNHTRGSSLHQGLLSAHYSPPMQLAPLYPERPRRHSRGRERDRDRDRRHSDCGMRPIGSSLDRPLSHQFQRSMSAQLLTVVPTTLSPMSSTGRLVDVQTTSPPTSPTLMSPQPSPGLRAASIHSMRSGSISMSGPFPGRHLSYGDLDEFFPVLPATSPSPKERSRRASHSSQRRSSSQPRI